tara:strand:+ start:120 stop:266 length:147 start_codon:yes stop_codon:yes gene_type:complete
MTVDEAQAQAQAKDTIAVSNEPKKGSMDMNEMFRQRAELNEKIGKMNI